MATPYIGNNDFRGYLNYLYQNQADPNKVYQDPATNSNFSRGDVESMLQMVGNDGILSNQQARTTSGGALQNQANLYYNYWRGQNQPAPTAQSTGVSVAAPVDTRAQDLAYLDDQEGQLRGFLGSAQNTLNNGLTQIGDSYDKEAGRATQQKDTALAGYRTQREDTTRDKMTGINQVNTGARTLADSVRRILGLASGANSSSYRDAAPGAIARDTSQKRSGVMDTFAKNSRNIDTAEQGTLSSFEDLLTDLGEQRKQKESGLRSGVLGQEQDTLGKLAEIAARRAQINGGNYDAIRAATSPIRADIQSRQAQIDGLFNQFRTPYTPKALNSQTPTMQQYQVDKTKLNAQQNQGGGEYSPYDLFLKKRFGAGV